MELATGYPFAIATRNYTVEETAKAILLWVLQYKFFQIRVQISCL